MKKTNKKKRNNIARDYVDGNIWFDDFSRSSVEILPMIFNEWQSYSERERNGLHGRHCQVA
jgi:hypothetical protein